MKDKASIKPGDIYAVHTGAYAGEMLLCIKVTKTEYKFLSIPNLINRNIDIPVVISGLNSKILQYVERVPDYVLKTSTAQYTYNEKTNNRRQQFNTQNILDSKESVETH